MSVEFSGGQAREAMRDVELAGVIAAGLGLPLDEEVKQHHPKVDVFAPVSKMNMMIVIEDEAGAESSAQTTPVTSGHLTGTASIAATAATLMTGVNPSVHGIVGDAWYTHMGENKHDAYHTESEYPLRATVADVVAMMNAAQSASSAAGIVIAASSSATLARALGARPSLRSTTVATLEWDAQVGAVRGAAAVPSLALDYATVIRIIQERFPSHVIQTDDAHTALYAELAIMFRTIAHLATAAPSSRATNFLAFGIHGLSLVKQTAAADTYAAASELVREAVKAAVAEYTSVAASASVDAVAPLYQIVRVSRHHVNAAASSASADEQAQLNVAHRVLAQFSTDYRGQVHLTRTFPHVYLRQVSRREQVCEALRQSAVQVYCPTTTATADSRSTSAYARNTASTNNTTTPISNVTFADVSAMHIVLWSSIFMGAALLAILYAFVTANDDDKDTLLFRMTAIKHVKNA
jgi:hypothetical protein